MATTIQSLRLTARRCSCRIVSQNSIYKSPKSFKQFSTTTAKFSDDLDQSESLTSAGSNVAQAHSSNVSAAEPAGSTSSTSGAQKREFEALLARGLAELRNEGPSQDFQDEGSEDRGRGLRATARGPKPKPGFLNMGEEGLDLQNEEDPEFEMDDVSSVAHAELEQHREFREYARLAAWEMPLLTEMAKDFVPPTTKEVLRFRYTTYMGEEHPAEKKVVVEFCPADLPDLTPIQREKIKKLVGVRYNPETDVVKMSCEMFETQAQNKRYLGDLVDTLLKEARDPTDDFADVPLDTRHHPIKVKPRFPKEWRMTEQRRVELEAFRQQAQLTDQQRALQGAIVDGVQKIEQSLAKRALAAAAEPVPEMVPIGKGKAKGRKLAVRR